MSNSYFSADDSSAFSNGSNADVQVVYEKFSELNRLLHRRIRELSWDLHPHWNKKQIVARRTVSTRETLHGMSTHFTRSHEQALLVERLMGREASGWSEPTESLEADRHPVIELRLTPTHFAIELIVSPDSWLDQQNLIGKMAVQRHRQTLRNMIAGMPNDFCVGFWSGIEVADMHLTTGQLARGMFLDEWLSTFQDGQDHLRFGVWYDPEDAALSVQNIVTEATRRIGMLYNIHTFLLWTSNNDFRTFYSKVATYPFGKDTRMS
ncbi:MAG: hypothetical protein IH587_14935 [Anaerolineae bacterium]|nr:hypothetical protein [Anaerolineae bacterium]